MASFSEIDASVRDAGLVPRGSFHPVATDGVPALADGRPCRTLVLVGDAGGSLWPAFASAPEFASGPDRLDRWTCRVMTEVASRLGAVALYPFGGPPHHPFQRWALRAEAVWPSPLGLLIHPGFGLWHAYRSALSFADEIALPPGAESPSPCVSCVGRPCLSACPVGAFTGERYLADACKEHVRSADGAECRDRGCLARRACPVGRDAAYCAAQQRFHMAAFISS